MAKYRIAHRRVQGQDVILVPLDSRFDNLSDYDQRAFLEQLQQHCSVKYQLAGRVALVWPTSFGGSRYLGPQEWSPFLRSVNFQEVLANVNLEIDCD